MKLWIDDVRPAPDGYEWVTSVEAAKKMIMLSEWRVKNAKIFCEGIYPSEDDHQCALKDHIQYYTLEVIDIDHDAGDYGPPDYIKLLDWLEETGRNYPIHIHSMNPIGVINMRAIIQRNGWQEV